MSLSKLTSQMALALLLILYLTAKYSFAHDNQTVTETTPSHLSWTSNYTRYDFVFNTETPIKTLLKLESDSNNYLTNSLAKCTETSACLFKNGTYLESFQVDNSKPHVSSFTSTTINLDNISSPTECDTGNDISVLHYCSTHWNPPVYLSRLNCRHRIEWHSPTRCHSAAINHEHPCYTYESSGKLIDLTPWILSNGSSYKVDIGLTNETKIKEFNLNICNEAHDPCGPNVSSCLIDEQQGLIETGYNNLTSIKYESNDKSVLLTYLGHYKQQCPGSRIKTVVRFTCKNKVISQSRPKLIRSSGCENIVEWPTVRACPVSEVRTSATDCEIKYEPLGIDIDIKRITNNRTMVEVPNMNLDGKNMTMLLGLCQGIPRALSCEGKSTSTTKACLLDATDNSTARSANNSQIVGSVTKSFIRLSDDRVYMESFAFNKTCSETVRKDFNVTQQLGTRIEFFCSNQAQDTPTFLGYDDCTYVFEWGSPLMCLESFSAPTNESRVSSETKAAVPEGAINPQVIETKSVSTGDKQTKEESRKSDAVSNLKSSNKPSTMNTTHKFFMISLIVMSFGAFIVVIFILDKKTRLRVTLRQARQAFQTNHQQPYSRVVNNLDL